MSSEGFSSQSQSSGDEAAVIDRTCDEFEQSWLKGDTPQIEDLLNDIAPAVRPKLLEELIALELFYRYKNGESTSLHEYLSRFPELTKEIFLKLVIAEHELLKRHDPKGSLNELFKRYPEWELELLEIFDVSTTTLIEVIEGPHKNQRFEFTEYATLIVGRSSAAQVCLKNDPYFSRHHCRLEINPPDCFFVDLGSRNGTAINGEKTKEQLLRDGDVLSGGRTKLQFRVVREERDKRPTKQGDRNTRFDALTERKTSQQIGREDDAFGTVYVQIVPGYEVVEELGCGAMGVVYRAIQKASGNEVALKVILPQHESSEQSMQLFLREANNLCQLNHPRIVAFKEFGMFGGQLFLVMEYVKTIDLKTLLRSQPQESAVRIPCAIACQVLEALTYAHSHSLVHRDIKPKNILLTKQKRKLHVKLADFGLSKNYINAGFSGLTSEGESRGTLAYMPPEQVIDSRSAKPPADIYAVGATLYHYLVGSTHFDFSSGASPYAMVLEADPIPLLAQRPDCPPELAAIVHRALEKDWEKRFRSANEMRQALEPFSKRR